MGGNIKTTMNIQQIEKHLKILRFIYWFFCVIYLLYGFLLLFLIESLNTQQEKIMFYVLMIFVWGLSYFLALTSSVLKKRKKWSWICAIIASALFFTKIFSLPIGIYGLWLLIKPEVAKYLKKS
ncbi:MAG: hypothetical protein ACD_58C00027G0003 [uncultured bacterium]|nr:MAG: hypothetical protein ACD_58C00027G0003 [uncultured bacterium]